MDNVINFSVNRKGEIVIIEDDANLEGFTRTTPEHSTLLSLCINHFVKAFEVENTQSGQCMTMVYFEYDDWINVYTDSNMADSKHLFFWTYAMSKNEDVIKAVLDMLGESWVTTK